MVLSEKGSLVTYTTVWVARSGITPPYTVGQVDLDDGVRIFAHVRGIGAEARVPMVVRLVLSSDPLAVPAFWFEPEAAQ
jgi:uncharacterized OB-fold protein